MTSAAQSASKTCKLNLVLAWGIHAILTMATAQLAGNTSCPVSFDYLKRFPSTLATCDQTDLRTNITVCCSALLNSLGIALAENLKNTGDFEFRDNATATACLADFQAGLKTNGVKQDFVSACFPYPYRSTSRFIRSKDLCGGIATTDDWNKVVGRTDMDKSCAGDLSRGSDCQNCVADAELVVRKLNQLSPGREECLYFTVLYATGIVNVLGPSEPSTLECLLGINSSGSRKDSSLDKAVIIVLAVVVPTSILFVFVIGLLIRKLQLNRKAQAALLSELGIYKPGSGLNPNRGLVVFKTRELRAATKNFSDANLIGEGATARVYKGELRGQGAVAIKVMKASFMQDLYEDEQKFLEQMKLANSIKHKNLVQLRGCAIADKEGLLLQHRVMVVYDYMPNGNLENAVLRNGLNRTLSWPERRKMAVDIAIAINYLHNELQPAVIHRDIKPSNILLDSNFNARLADFGLAKQLAVPDEVSVAVGTPLFVAPEYGLYGHLTTKSDVYSFGMVMLMLLSRQRPLFHSPESNSQVHIGEWAWELMKNDRHMDVYEESIRRTGPESVMHRFVVVAVVCAHPLVAVRPSISQALGMLQGDIEVPEPLHDRPAFGQFPTVL